MVTKKKKIEFFLKKLRKMNSPLYK